VLPRAAHHACADPIENRIAAQQMTPAFDGPSLLFNRTIALK
jgi:hypothetical protein